MTDIDIKILGLADIDALQRLVIGFRDHLGAKSPASEELRVSLSQVIGDETFEFAGAWLGGAAVRIDPEVCRSWKAEFDLWWRLDDSEA